MITSDSAAKSLDARRQADDVADVAQVRHEAALEAADQRVGVAALHRERGDHGGVGAHHVRAASGVTPWRPAASR